MSDTPTLSPQSVAVLTEVLGNVTIPVTHPQFEEVTAAWTVVRRELAAIAEYQK
jgi:hypothetical protein